MITLKEIADQCGVSAATVSNILNGKPKVSEATKNRVLKVVQESGYQPNFFAQGIRKKKTGIIGIITEDLIEFSATPIVESIMAVCEKKNYRTILSNMRMYDRWQDTWYQDTEKLKSVLLPILQEMQAIRVDGIIYVAGHFRKIDYIPADFSIPVLIAYGMSGDGRYTSVILDDERGGYEMTKYLISEGHKKIGVIAGTADNHHARQRLMGYQRALDEAGIPYDPSLVVYGNWDRNSGFCAMEKLLKEDITGIFCMNDTMAAGAYNCIYQHELTVGKDLSVVGYDNRNISEYLRPMLTTCDLQLVEVGRKSALLLIAQIDRESAEPSAAKVIKIKSRIVTRNSVERNSAESISVESISSERQENAG